MGQSKDILQEFELESSLNLDLDFDESQEIPASMTQDKVFLNWLTNDEHTQTWKFEDTKVLDLTILDSPRDDPEEQLYKIDLGGGVMKSRLHFLGGKKPLNKKK